MSVDIAVPPHGLTDESGASPVLSFLRMSKAFGGTQAVSDVSLDLMPGQILALLGQNGAGKSTLIKMLAGVVEPDAGEIRFAGRRFNPHEDTGVAFIHQDLGLIEWMTVAENIALAQGYPKRRGLIDWSEVEAMARRSLRLIAYDIDPRRRVADLTRTEKSLVAIARALGIEAQVLVLDEPTASLSQDDVQLLFEVLRGLKSRGVSMIYVSHRLDEVFAISDTLAVLRDGRLVDQRRTSDADPESLIASIIGRRPEGVFSRPPPPRSHVLLQCHGVCVNDVGPIDLSLRSGELLALVGLRGAGHESVGRALIGDEAVAGGSIDIDGSAMAPTSIAHAIRRGVGLVAADRVGESIATGMSVRENIFVNPGASGRGLFTMRNSASEADESARLGQAVGLTPNDPEAAIETLSGGNQQKAVMSRWFRIEPKVLVLEDPTAGVDVGAKLEIYRLLARALEQGQAILLISTDFEEVAAICHRALVFQDGTITAEIDASALSIESLTRAASMGHAHQTSPTDTSLAQIDQA